MVEGVGVLPRTPGFCIPVVCVPLLVAMASSPAASVQVPAMAGYPAAAEPAIVAVVTPGAAPRRALRYVVAPTYRASARVSMGMTVTSVVQGEKTPATLPPILIEFDLGVTAVHPDGAISYDMTFTSLDVDGPGVDPSALAAMRTALSGVAGLTGSATVSSRGETRAIRFDIDRLSDSQVRQAMAQAMSGVDNLSIPLPEEAVGPGARWEALQTTVSDGVHVFQKTSFELVSIDGPVVTLRSSFQQEAPLQWMTAADLPGAKMRLDRMHGSGTGTIVIHLDALVPRSDVNLSTSSTISMTSGGRRAPMRVGVQMALAVAPTR
jgi:hypothetical protein